MELVLLFGESEREQKAEIMEQHRQPRFQAASGSLIVGEPCLLLQETFITKLLVCLPVNQKNSKGHRMNEASLRKHLSTRRGETIL